MEIRIQRTVIGRDEKARIMRKYGDRVAVKAAADTGDADAMEALFSLDLFDEDPRRLSERTTYGQAFVLETPDLSKLTWTRLRIVDDLRRLGPMNLKELTRHLGRDPKNVSNDVACLESFGLIESERRGKEKIIRAAGDEVLIRL